MATIRRLFGFKDEAGPAQSYDDLTMGAVPDADTFWPVTGGTLDKNTERIDRNDEVRGRRANTAPRPFRAAPVLTVPVRAYLSVIAKGLRKTLGGTDVVTGAMSPYNHALGVLGLGAGALPTVSAQLVRDDLNHKLSGCAFNRASLTFPLDGEGTAEFELWGLYHAHFATAPPSATFTGMSDDVLMLRDAEVFIDGSGTAIQDLTNFAFSFTNNLTRKWYAKRNVVTQTLGTPAQTRKLWFPEENKLGAAQDVTYTIGLGNVNAAQELAEEYGQIQKFVFDVAGGPITGGTELLRITIYGGAHSGGGAEALSARDDITASFDGGAFYSTTDAADILVEVVNGSNTVLT